MREPIHMLLTDVVMPQMSGKVLANHMAALHPETRVLYMSGYDEAVVRHGILEANTFFFSRSPSPRRLVQKVREVLDTDTQCAHSIRSYSNSAEKCRWVKVSLDRLEASQNNLALWRVTSGVAQSYFSPRKITLRYAMGN